ncbi:hypothetical protein PCNPT3_10160 [Psychromonas sp. CNPT3]|uniref:GGDEF domain-containing protein n=1 Tax=Psychromonas sp. CNPT3 TaxID=314282 RepID=UPI00006E585F|nr:GGDEF domain-containing protein [Psychromonas sp. CNPT3]AGH81970.1 hypothetical protein PCNPT3_10160 [Psychromonas sp. CNPT3]
MQVISHKRRDYLYAHSPTLEVLSNVAILTTKDKLTCLELLQGSLDINIMMASFCTLVAKFVRPFNISFKSAHTSFNKDNKTNYKCAKTFHFPLSSTSPCIGQLTYESEQALSHRDNKILMELHLLLLPMLKHTLKLSELNIMVFKDHLTNIGNRAYYDEVLQLAIDKNYRDNKGLSLLIFDVNDFKNINDTYGHFKGDQVLQQFAHLLTTVIRASDMAFRLGGDEFAIVLQATTDKSSNKVQQRLSDALKEDPFLSTLSLSSSVGCAHWDRSKTALTLFQEADEDLYKHKKSNKGKA